MAQGGCIFGMVRKGKWRIMGKRFLVCSFFGGRWSSVCAGVRGAFAGLRGVRGVFDGLGGVCGGLVGDLVVAAGCTVFGVASLYRDCGRGRGEGRGCNGGVLVHTTGDMVLECWYTMAAYDRRVLLFGVAWRRWGKRAEGII